MQTAFLKVLPCLSAISSFTIASYITNYQTSIQSMNTNKQDSKQPETPETIILTRSQIDKQISENEGKIDVGYNHLSYYTFNQFSANNPIEDRFAIRTSLHTQSLSGSLFAVYDGHSGIHCSHFCEQELFDFIEYTSATRLKKRSKDRLEIIDDELECLSPENYRKFLDFRSSHNFLPFTRSFLLADECFLSSVVLNSSIMNHGNTGSCAVVSYINQMPDKYPNDTWITTAWVGDCRSIIGHKEYDLNRHRFMYKAIELTIDHQIDLNAKEKHRLLSEHPHEKDIIKRNRVKGRLQPTRVFGDGHYKRMDLFYNWKNCEKYRVWNTPYVTAKPDVSCYHLEMDDAFMVLASDGLFQDLSSGQVVEMVGEFLENGSNVDGNSSSFLIEKALLAASEHRFGNLENVDESLSQILTLPENGRRSIYDDITVLVVVFDHKLKNRNIRELRGEQRPVQIPIRLKTLLEQQNMSSKL